MRLAVARRMGFGLADQVLSSLTNFAVSFSVARSVGPRGLGAFGLAFSTYILALGASRALNTDALVVRYSAASHDDWKTGAALATGAALTTGLVFGAGCLAVSFVVGGVASGVFLVLGLGFPGLLLQDSWRYALVSARRTGLAALNDLTWALVMLPLVVVLIVTGRATAATMTLAWAIGATAGSVLGVFQARVVPGLHLLTWWRQHRDLGPRYFGEFLVAGGAGELTLYAVGGLAGLAAVGALRAAILLVGPFNVLLMGIGLVAVPEGARVLRRSPAHLRRGCLVLSVGLTAVVLCWGAIVLSLPTSVGRHLLHENWGPARHVVPGVIAYTVASAVTLGAAIGLKTLGEPGARRSLTARLATGPLVILGGVVGCAVANARGAAWGMALGNAVGAVITWWQLGFGLPEYESRPETADVDPLGMRAPTPRLARFGRRSNAALEECSTPL